MASLNVRGKDGTVYSLSGSAYHNDVEGTKKLCVRTGLNYGDVETYGLATVSTATEYSPIAFNVNGSTAYIGRKETYYTYSTNSQISTSNATVVNTVDINTMTNSKTLSVSATENVNYGTSYLTTLNNQGELSVLYTESSLSNFPSPTVTSAGIVTSGKEIYKTYYSVSEAQKVCSYQLTNYHSWNYYVPLTASTSGTGDYHCEATRTGDWVDQGYVDVNSNYGYRTFYGHIRNYNYMAYNWTASTWSNFYGRYYYDGTGYHAPNAGVPYGGDFYYMNIRVNGNGNVGETQIGTGTLLNANTTYTRTAYRNTMYTLSGSENALMTTYNSSRRSQSSAYAKTTLAKTLTLTSDHQSSIVESTWWTTSNAYNNTTVYGACHSIDNAVQTIVNVSSSYVYKSLASTASSTQAITFSGLMSSSNSIYTSKNETMLESILFSKAVNCSMLKYSSSSYSTLNNGVIPQDPIQDCTIYSNIGHNFIQ